MPAEEYLEAYLRHAGDFVGPIVREEILSEESSRMTVFPIKYHTIWRNYKEQIKVNWIAEKIKFNKDIEDWKNLNDDERWFIMHILAFFGGADGLVNVNISENLIKLIRIKEAECAYGRQFAMENIHGESYSLMLDTLVEDPKLRAKLFDAIRSMPCIAKKAAWARDWIESDKTFAHKLVAFMVMEGVFFSGAFASIFWLKTRPGSIMPGLRKANKYIARDERLHVELAVEIYKLLTNRLREEVVYNIIRNAVNIETEFIVEALPCRLLGMNSEDMAQYVQYCADRVLLMLGYSRTYHVENPFDFMSKIDSYSKENFFEERPDSYVEPEVENTYKFGFVSVRC